MIGMRQGEWTLLCAPEHLELARRLALQVPPPQETTEIFRDDYRSFVGVLQTDEGKIIVKSPRLKNRSRWIRWTTLLRAGEAVETIRGLWRARNQGVPVAEPILAMERRAGGKVVDSWMFFSYVEGRRCEKSEYAAVIDALQRLHDAGWIHGDPHFENFVWDGERVRILDCRPRRAPWGAVSRAYDFVLLGNSRPELEPYLEARGGPFPFRLALAYDHWIHGWRAWKKRLRSTIGRPRDAAAPAGRVRRDGPVPSLPSSGETASGPSRADHRRDRGDPPGRSAGSR